MRPSTLRARRRTLGRRCGPLSRSLLACALVLGAVWAGVPGGAQSQDEIDRIREERRQVEAEARQKASEVNVADAELEEISAALVALNSAVGSQESRVEDAERQLRAAETTLAESEAAVEEGLLAIEALQDQLRTQAITSFVDGGEPSTLIVETEDPLRALRMQSLIDEVTRSGVDVAEALRSAEEDLRFERERAAEAAERAGELRAEMESELVELEKNQAVQADLTAAAENRLEALLAEQAGLERLGVQLAADEQAARDRLAAELARKQAAAPTTPQGAPAPSGPGGSRPPVADASEIVNAGNGIWVHQSIAGNVSQLLADAAAAGIELRGGGYRDPSGQIAVRRANCGTSDYAIYEAPSSSCRPPTARPGSSMHERGLAVDFTYNGRIIASRSGPAWEWLKANASRYGLFNLPSEPWHWSTTGG